MQNDRPVQEVSFPPTARLHRPAEFGAALKGRRLARGALFILTKATAAPDSTDDAQARLGLIIAKRFAPRAVTRNAPKRVVRESFRHRRMQLPAADYVIRLHSRVALSSLTEIKKAARAEADAHFVRAAK